MDGELRDLSMTVVNTGDPFYDGLSFANGSEALILIRDNLAAWTIVNDNIPSSLLMRGETSNSHECFIYFAIAGNEFEVRMDANGSNTLSDPLTFTFTPGSANRLWLTYDNDSGVICIRNEFTYQGAIAFGFLDRFDETDDDAWGIFGLRSEILEAIVFRSKHSNSLFRRIGDDFNDADNFASTNLSGPYQGVFDRVISAYPFGSYTNTGSANAAYSAQNGQNNSNGRPVIDRLYYIEGRGSIDAYLTTNNNPLPLYCLGYVKHAGVGFAKRGAGERVLDQNGDRWLVSGNDGFQAMRIVESPASANVFLPTVLRPEIGVAFADSSGAISEIINTLTNAGWLVQEQTTSFVRFEGTHRDNVEKAYIKFTETSPTILTVEGCMTPDDSNKSTALVFDFAQNNLVFEIANQEAGAIQFNTDAGFWFGFLLPAGREDNAQPLWGLGMIIDGIQQTYIAINNEWVSISKSFNFVTSQLSSFPTINGDRLAVACNPVLFYDNAVAENAAFRGQNGQKNGATNRFELSYYAIINGRNTTTGYGIAPEGENNAPFHQWLGVVQFVTDGMKSANGGETQAVGDGAVFRSVGGAGWNGARVA